ncbi:LPXTG cell wall anchor domain-containing protein [Enterococcus casseliflavus]|nr:LPXTG cell wall anchor domain-containing protein [Enterococcus casseliflavus]
MIIFSFNGFLLASADENESTATVTIYEEVFSNSNLDENDNNEDTSETKNIAKTLPKTNERNSQIFSLLGLMISGVALLGFLYIKIRNGEQYIEKN